MSVRLAAEGSPSWISSDPTFNMRVQCEDENLMIHGDDTLVVAHRVISVSSIDSHSIDSEGPCEGHWSSGVRRRLWGRDGG